VAGFDATFRFHPGDHDLIAALMFAARRRARTLRVRWHSALDAEGNGYCSMDGNTFRLDMLLERLRRDLPTIAEASPSGRHTPLQRRRLANGLCDILCRSRVGYYDRYYREDQPQYVPRVRRLRSSEVWPVHQLWVGENHLDLSARLGVTEEIMASWVLNEVAPEVVLEEMHTAAELLLMRLMSKRRAPAFAELVELAQKAGHLEKPLAFAYDLDLDDPERFDHAADLLISLKEHRKRTKHQGTDEARAWLDRHFWAAGSVLEQLARQVQGSRR
jgi:hypothetical protein